MKANLMTTTLGILFSILLFACSSHPVIPETKDIVVSRDEAKTSCKSLGSIEGRSTSLKANPEEALADMKQEAIKKGANYVKMETMGAQGTAVRGEAFYCP